MVSISKALMTVLVGVIYVVVVAVVVVKAVVFVNLNKVNLEH